MTSRPQVRNATLRLIGFRDATVTLVPVATDIASSLVFPGLVLPNRDCQFFNELQQQT